MSNVLVTGGAGFIGSHLADAMVARGHDVTVIDNLSTGVRENVPSQARFVEASVADPDSVAALFADTTFDLVLHVAGQASIVRSFDAPEHDLDVNVRGTLNVLSGCVATRVPRLVFASSMTIYGNPELVPTPETALARPASNYGVSKYAAERYVQIAGGRDDIELAVTSLRMFNVYGERQSLSNPYQGVLAIFIGNLLRGEPITIHGDGAQTRDFVHVDDVVRAWLAVVDEPATAGQVYNVGSGRETTISELADAVLAAFGETRDSYDMRHASAQLGDLRRSAGEVAQLAAATGWAPQVSLDDGMRRTIGAARS